jgi:NAD(P)-dependent dehydrogenase (short-subunit alcohol dehydrogenase family)
MEYSDKRLLGLHTLVTGAGSGLGKAIALRYAREGANVAVCDINIESAQKTCDEVTALGVSGKVFSVDVSNSDQVQKLVTDYYAHFPTLDVLVNNAGIGGSMAQITSLDEEKWDRMMAINLRGVFLMCKYFGKMMKKRKCADNELRGKIINMASMRGKRGRAMFGDYSAAKFGVVSLTQTLAIELGGNRITVNAICPGLIHTPIYGNISYENLSTMGEPICLKYKPVGLPEDVAGAAFFLASHDSDWITGQSLPVCGGMHFV